MKTYILDTQYVYFFPELLMIIYTNVLHNLKIKFTCLLQFYYFKIYDLLKYFIKKIYKITNNNNYFFLFLYTFCYFFNLAEKCIWHYSEYPACLPVYPSVWTSTSCKHNSIAAKFVCYLGYLGCFLLKIKYAICV